MFESTLDNYAHSNALKNVNTYFKVLFAIITLFICLVSTSALIPILIFLLLSFLILFKAKIPSMFYLKFIAVPLLFAFITLVYMSIFFGIGIHILELGFFNLAVTADGLNLGILLISRMMGCFSCLAFLALTTPMTELFSVLEKMRIPTIVMEIAMLMYRFIFLFLDEAVNMYHSQETRLGYSSLKKTYKSMGMLASNLFIRTWVKGEKAYIAMESRCYDGSMKTIKSHENIRSIGFKNFALLTIFEVILSIGTYLTASFRIF